MKRLCAALLLLTLTACGDALVLKPAKFDSLTDFAVEDHVAALSTYLNSCEAILKRSPDATIGKPPLEAPASAWQENCRKALDVPLRPDAAKAFFETEFVPYLATNNGKAEGLFTGYYIPETRGSLTRTGKFTTPVYGVPNDLSSAPYHTRAEINDGALKGKAPIIAWVDDPVALFFIEIQGSGMLRLQDGSIFTIGYAGKNNRAFIPIGRVMAEQGLIDKGNITLDTIKQWLYDNPQEGRAVMEENPSFVFFKHLADGVIRGGQGIGLTDERSLAIDTRFLPYGMPLYLDTELPKTDGFAPRNFHQLMIAQDTGGAIRGPVRGDVYFGKGTAAERKAGNMKQRGRYTLLIPKSVYNDIKDNLPKDDE
jgi:membrane-bound lytic murein transglycosylase A